MAQLDPRAKRWRQQCEAAALSNSECHANSSCLDASEHSTRLRTIEVHTPSLFALHARYAHGHSATCALKACRAKPCRTLGLRQDGSRPTQFF